MHPAAPTAPAPQHLEALAHANRVRLARAALKRAVASGETSVAEVVRDVPWEAETMSVFDLVCSQRRWGDTRCKRVLRATAISETKTVGALTERQRLALAGALEAGSAPARAALVVA